MSDIVVLYWNDKVEILHSNYKKTEAEIIFKIFLSSNKMRLINETGNDYFELEYKDKYFKIDMVEINKGYKLFAFQDISLTKEYENYTHFFTFINYLVKAFIRKIVSGSFNKKDWYYFLKKIVIVFDEVDSASLILEDKDGYFRYISVYNHNLQGLKSLRLFKEDFVPERFEKVTVLKLDEVLDEFHFNDKRREEITKVLIKYGNLPRIKSLMSIPIFKNNKCVGFIVLDNWDREDAFDNKFMKKFAKTISQIISNLFSFTAIYEESLK